MKSKNKFRLISFFVLVSSLVMTTYSCKSGIDSNALLMIALINQQSAIKKGTTWKVSKTDTSKTITDVSGKKLYAVRYNSGSSALSTSDQKTITVYSGTRSLTSDDNNTNILPQNIENDDSRTYLSLPVYTPSSLGLNITEPSLLAKTVTPTPSYNSVGDTCYFYVKSSATICSPVRNTAPIPPPTRFPRALPTFYRKLSVRTATTGFSICRRSTQSTQT